MVTSIDPVKTCELNRLVTQPKLITLAINGTKTQQRRNGIYAYPGERFKLEGIAFKITGFSRQALGNMTEDDAKAESFTSLSDY